MHELSVCQALLTAVAEIARQRGADVVDHITVEIGPLAGIEPGLLLNAFSIMRLGGMASGAELRIETIETRITCLTCGAQSTVPPNRLVCDGCGGFRTRVTAGDELRLRRVQMRLPEGSQGLAN